MDEEPREEPSCPYCGAPKDRGHARDCPVLTRHHEKYAGRPEPGSDRRFEVSKAQFSKERLSALRHGFEKFQAQNPEALAFGMFGSMVQGRAIESSDIDGFLFLDAVAVLAKNKDSSIDTVTSEVIEHTGIIKETMLDDKTEHQYSSAFRETIVAESEALTAEHLPHLFVRPVSYEIIDQHIEEFVDLIHRFDEWIVKSKEREDFLAQGGEEKRAPSVPEKPTLMQVSPNLVSLFYLQLGHGLDPYRNYLLEKLSQMGEVGEVVWKGIGRGLEAFEQGTITDKKYPRTLEEAKGTYLKNSLSPSLNID